MKYVEHKAKWDGCTACLLSDQRKRMVFARGKIPCDILLVGEAPGVSEDTIGKPFIGPAGHLLDAILAEALSPDVRYCITNLVCCFPREAKEGANHEPPEEAIRACIPRLAEFYTICRPKILIAVGKLAARYLDPLLWGPKASIRLPKTHDSFASIMHPAAILRLDIAQRPLAFRRAVATLSGLASALPRAGL